jgi:hypothetical protein
MSMQIRSCLRESQSKGVSVVNKEILRPETVSSREANKSEENGIFCFCSYRAITRFGCARVDRIVFEREREREREKMKSDLVKFSLASVRAALVSNAI